MSGQPGKSGGRRAGSGRPPKPFSQGDTVVISIQGPGVSFRLVEMTVISTGSRMLSLESKDGWRVAVTK